MLDRFEGAQLIRCVGLGLLGHEYGFWGLSHKFKPAQGVIFCMLFAVGFQVMDDKAEDIAVNPALPVPPVIGVEIDTEGWRILRGQRRAITGNPLLNPLGCEIERFENVDQRNGVSFF
eukprot:GHVU01215046.1.p1 GENE.GHVU01215046.1~~GHVU01215046.1.p1  ORF type:complete len:118 (+),score=6.78 GHVU01215046.1:172-525(+)